jgi:hypothetical protein
VWERFRKTKPQAVKIGIEQDKSFNTLGNKKYNYCGTLFFANQKNSLVTWNKSRITSEKNCGSRGTTGFNRVSSKKQQNNTSREKLVGLIL